MILLILALFYDDLIYYEKKKSYEICLDLKYINKIDKKAFFKFPNFKF